MHDPERDPGVHRDPDIHSDFDHHSDLNDHRDVNDHKELKDHKDLDSHKDFSENTLHLISRAKEGDATAFNELYRIYKQRLARVVNRELGSKLRARMETEDLIQSVWKDILPDMKTFEYRGHESFFRWLRLKLGRKILDKFKEIKTQKRDVDRERPIYDDELDGPDTVGPATDPTPSWVAIHNEDVERINSLLKYLPEEQRKVVIYRFRNGMDFEEIGKEMNRSAGASRQLYYRALRKIQLLTSNKKENE